MGNYGVASVGCCALVASKSKKIGCHLGVITSCVIAWWTQKRNAKPAAGGA